MNIKSISNSILLTNNDDKKFLNIKGLNESDKRRIIQIDNELDFPVVKNFLTSSIKSIKYIKSYIGDNRYKECIELKNSGNSNLVIVSDDVNKYFKNLLDYINDNRTDIYERYLFDCMCKYDFDEIIFELSSNNKHSEIKMDNNKLYYYIPYEVNEKNKKIISDKDLKLIQNTINNYVGITKCNLRRTYDEGALGYLLKFKILTDKANILINNSEIYYGLELYFNLIKRDIELDDLKKREKDNIQSEKNKVRSKLKVLKKDNNNNNNEE